MDEEYSNVTSDEPSVTFAFATSTGLIIELSVMMVVAIVGNTCTIAAFHLDAAVRSNPSDRYILSLAWANLGIGMCAMPTQLICRILWRELPTIFCRLMYTLDYSFAAVTLYMITLICIDRYFLVSSSYSRYINIQNRRNIRWTIIIAWILALVVGASQNLSWGESTHKIFNSYTPCCAGPVIAKKIPLVILYVCYGIIPSILVAIFGTLFLVALRRRMKRWKEKSAKHTRNYHALKGKRTRVAKKIASSHKMPSLSERHESRRVNLSVDELSKMEKATERAVTRQMKASSTETMETDLNTASIALRRKGKINASSDKQNPMLSSNETSNLSPTNSLPEELEQESTKLLGCVADEDQHPPQVNTGGLMPSVESHHQQVRTEGQRGAYSPLPVRRFAPATTLESEPLEPLSTNFISISCGEETILQIKEGLVNDMQDSTEELRMLSNNNINTSDSNHDSEISEEMNQGPTRQKGSFRLSAGQGEAPEITIDPASCSQNTIENEQIRHLNNNDPNKLHRPSITDGFSFHTLMSHLVSRGSSFRSSFRDMTPKIFRSRYIKPATVFGTLFIGMLICFIPTGVYMIVITTSCPECFDPFIFNYLAFLAYFNSCLNPILYIVSHTKIRRFYQKRFNRICHRD